MRTLVNRYLGLLSDTPYVVSLLGSAGLFCVALVANFWAVAQATRRAGAAVPDLILSNIPVFQVDGLFVWGTVAVAAVSIFLVLLYPNRMPFALYAIGLFILIRSGFTLLTHLGTPIPVYESEFGDTITNAFFGADQFFSAHTGMPLIGALAVWHQPLWRYFFIAASLFFAAVVLLGHIHYSIDVLSAFFITYGIYQIALWLFPKQREWFLRD